MTWRGPARLAPPIGARDGGLLPGGIALKQSGNREHNCDKERDDYRAESEPLPPCFCLPARQNVVRVQGGGLGLLGSRLGLPLLGFVKIFAAQQEASVFSFAFPFLGTHQQACMCLFPIEVRVECHDERGESSVKGVGFSEIHEIELCQLLGNVRVGHGPPQNGN